MCIADRHRLTDTDGPLPLSRMKRAGHDMTTINEHASLRDTDAPALSPTEA